MLRSVSLLILMLTAAAAPGQNEPVRTPEDETTRRALHAAFAGDADEIFRLAREREDFEAAERAEDWSPPRLADNLAALGAAASRPLLDRSEAEDRIDNFRPDGESAAVLRLIRRIEPREQYRTARSNRKYEDHRRAINSAIRAVSGALQLRLLSLIQPPLDAMQYAITGRPYLNPEERRELQAARALQELELPAWMDIPRSARRVVRGRMERRERLAQLQARTAAEEAEQAEMLDAAEWWYGRERLFMDGTEPFRDEHLELRAELRLRERLREESVHVIDGVEPVEDSRVRGNYTDVLHGVLLNPGSAETDEALRRFEWEHPLIGLEDDLLVARAAAAKARGGTGAARTVLELAAETDGRTAAAAQEYLSRPDWNPALMFEQARDAFSRRKRAWLFNGTAPAVRDGHPTAEQARLGKGGWIERARSLFLFDTISRAITLPLLPGNYFPRDEIFEAAETAPAQYLESEEGREELRRVACDYAKMRRYNDAARVWFRLGEDDRARRMQNKAARQLERAAMATDSPAARAELLRRVVSGYPEYQNADRARERLDEAERELASIATISRKDLRLFPELWGPFGLDLPPSVVTGDKDDGVMTKDGIRLLRGGRVEWERARDGEVQQQILAPDGLDNTLDLLVARRRTNTVDDELAKPPERLRVPLAIQGAAIPDFTVTPALVPLQTDPQVRKLYE